MSRRTDRLGELLRHEISGMLGTVVKDPRIGMATISRVEVTEDLSYAKVFVSVLGSDKDHVDTLIGLNRSAGYMRSLLFKSIKIRQMPLIQFVLDEGLDHSLKIQSILSELRQKGEKLDGDEQKPEA